MSFSSTCAGPPAPERGRYASSASTSVPEVTATAGTFQHESGQMRPPYPSPSGTEVANRASGPPGGLSVGNCPTSKQLRDLVLIVARQSRHAPSCPMRMPSSAGTTSPISAQTMPAGAYGPAMAPASSRRDRSAPGRSARAPDPAARRPAGFGQDGDRRPSPEAHAIAMAAGRPVARPLGRIVHGMTVRGHRDARSQHTDTRLMQACGTADVSTSTPGEQVILQLPGVIDVLVATLSAAVTYCAPSPTTSSLFPTCPA